MASKASIPPVIPSPSVAAGTMSPRPSPGGLHLNATKSLMSAVDEMKAVTSAVKDLNAAVVAADKLGDFIGRSHRHRTELVQVMFTTVNSQSVSPFQFSLVSAM